MFEGRDEIEPEHPDDERNMAEELYEPWEAYAGIIPNAKVIVYALTLCASVPAASAMHWHEYGQWGIIAFGSF